MESIIPAITVTLPAVGAFLAWMYAGRHKWQTVSRSAVLPMAVGIHLAVIGSVMLSGQMTGVVLAVGLVSLVVTLSLALHDKADRGPDFGESYQQWLEQRMTDSANDFIQDAQHFDAEADQMDEGERAEIEAALERKDETAKRYAHGIDTLEEWRRQQRGA